MWVFAYGSLIFRPGFAFIKREPATVPGYARRFWQGSPDHRGTPALPGRVVTLVPEPMQKCQGIAFQVENTLRQEVLDYLDERESGGYERVRLQVHLDTGETVEAWTWIAFESNSNFLGDASADSMVRQIMSARGQSGLNRDYVLNLARELSGLNIEDDHIAQLAQWIREADT